LNALFRPKIKFDKDKLTEEMCKIRLSYFPPRTFSDMFQLLMFRMPLKTEEEKKVGESKKDKPKKVTKLYVMILYISVKPLDPNHLGCYYTYP